MTLTPIQRNLSHRIGNGGKCLFVLGLAAAVATMVVMTGGGTSTSLLAQQEQAQPSQAALPPSTQEQVAQSAPTNTPTSVATDDTETPKKSEETDRQKELRAAVEKERAARGVTVKSLQTKLAEADKKPSNDPLQLTFDDLAFEMEKNDDFKRSMLSKDHDKLNQRKVSISGFIRPSARQSGLTKFVFVRDNLECCFGPGAALYDCILVKLAKGQKTDYTVRPVTIEGDFYIKEYTGPNGKTWAIFRMKNSQVK